MGKTKKTGISARFGPRYGANVRKKWRLIMEKQKGGNLNAHDVKQVDLLIESLRGYGIVRNVMPSLLEGHTILKLLVVRNLLE